MNGTNVYICVGNHQHTTTMVNSYRGFIGNIKLVKLCLLSWYRISHYHSPYHAYCAKITDVLSMKDKTNTWHLISQSILDLYHPVSYIK